MELELAAGLIGLAAAALTLATVAVPHFKKESRGCDFWATWGFPRYSHSLTGANHG
jgi:hypothetical protein